MHPKNDSDSDQICCLQSSGLCHTIGSKHHRSNKKCWSFPRTCEHCNAIRAASAEKGYSSASPESAVLSTPGIVPLKGQLWLSDPVSISNKGNIEQNSMVRPSIVPAVVDDCTTRAITTQVTIQAIVGMGVGAQHEEQTSDSIEQLQSLELLQTTPVPPRTRLMHEDDLVDLEQRMIRSQAPSPESYQGEELKSRLSSSQVGRLRDPRLVLNFVLEAA